MKYPAIFMVLLILAGPVCAGFDKEWSYGVEQGIKSMDCKDERCAVLSKDNVAIYFVKDKERWSRSVNKELNTISISNDLITAASTDGNIYVFNTKGDLLWWKNIGAGVGYKEAVFAGDYIAVGGINGVVYLFDANGSLLWNRTTGSYVVNVKLVNDTLFAVSDKQGYVFDIMGNERANLGIEYYIRSCALSDGTIALGLGDGTLHIFTADGLETGNYTIGDQIGTIAIMGKYVAVGARDGNLYLFDKNATLLWKQNLDSGVTSVGISGRNLYAVSLEDNVYLYTINGYQLASQNESGIIASYLDDYGLTTGTDKGKVTHYLIPTRSGSFGIFAIAFVVLIMLGAVVVLLKEL
ncbi:MAG: hypothetical protein MSIBF_01225 [Candidatus Altiarchaeales archaeon IMC4]|nr:MAG: hypothetical protein MSIBF_01225 [Candidatus Altiarchaeales archaeon IMC4]